MKHSFGSDNHSGIHPLILKAIEVANIGHFEAYGDDEITKTCTAVIKQHFGDNASPYFVFNGTAANVLSLKAIMQSFNSVICAETAHINVDECAAPEFAIGCKLVTVNTVDGKLTPELVRRKLNGFGFQHHTQPKVISISQPTELGTLYQPIEIQQLADLAHKYGMCLHVDGARLSNAAEALGLDFKSFTTDVGVDVVSLGGTKNGLMVGEAVIFLNDGLDTNFKYVRKQSMQLYSKSRFIAAQFNAFLSENIYLSNARRANQMAQLLYSELKVIEYIRVTQKVETNAVFVTMPRCTIDKLLESYCFYVWNEDINEVRLMTSFDTTPDDVKKFIDVLKKTHES